MASLQQFRDYQLARRDKQIHSPDDILNDALKSNAPLMKRMLKGKSAYQVVQSGDRIVAHIQLTDSGTAGWYTPNDTASPTMTSTMRGVAVNWRFLRAFKARTEQEIMLASGDDATRFFNLRKQGKQEMYTSMLNTFQSSLWAEASTADMESDGGTKPYSIQMFVNTGVDTVHQLLANYTTTVGANTALVQTLNPALNANYRNQTTTYSASDPGDQYNGIVAGFDTMWHKVRFASPGTKKEYETEEKYQKQCIFTNLEGRTKYIQFTRGNNDRMANVGAFTAEVDYSGIPVEYESELDTATGILGTTATTIPTGRPVYFWLNLDFLFPVFHSKKYMDMKIIDGGPDQPETFVEWSFLWCNLICISRRRQGIVYAA